MAAILVLDDERSIRDMLEVYLARQGHRVTCASTLADALILLRGKPFRVGPDRPAPGQGRACRSSRRCDRGTSAAR